MNNRKENTVMSIEEIADFFGVCTLTARKYVDGFLSDSVEVATLPSGKRLYLLDKGKAIKSLIKEGKTYKGEEDISRYVIRSRNEKLTLLWQKNHRLIPARIWKALKNSGYSTLLELQGMKVTEAVELLGINDALILKDRMRVYGLELKR